MESSRGWLPTRVPVAYVEDSTEVLGSWLGLVQPCLLRAFGLIELNRASFWVILIFKHEREREKGELERISSLPFTGSLPVWPQ